MSMALYWASGQRPVRPLDKLVLIAFADHADKTTAECYPSVAALCEWTGCDRKTVMKATASLEAAKLLIDTGQRRGRTLQVKVYRLPVETVPEAAPLAETVPETGLLKGTVFPTKESQKRDTEPPKEPPSKKTTSSQKKRVRAKVGIEIPDWVPADAWNGWIEMRKRKGKPLTDRAAAQAIDRLKALADDGYPPGGVLDQSTFEAWTGLFPIKEHRNGLSQRNDHASGTRSVTLAGPRRGFGADMLAAAHARPEDDPEGDPRDSGGAEGTLPAYLRR